MEADCWEWLGRVGSDGYGWDGNARAHRAAWIRHFGPIPNGLFVCHHCDNRRCVRPSHLFLGTNAMNLRDAAMKGRNIRQREPNIGRRGPRLSQAVVAAIRERHANGESGAALAREHGISEAAVSRYVTGSRATGQKMGPPFRRT